MRTIDYWNIAQQTTKQKLLAVKTFLETGSLQRIQWEYLCHTTGVLEAEFHSWQNGSWRNSFARIKRILKSTVRESWKRVTMKVLDVNKSNFFGLKAILSHLWLSTWSFVLQFLGGEKHANVITILHPAIKKVDNWLTEMGSHIFAFVFYIIITVNMTHLDLVNLSSLKLKEFKLPKNNYVCGVIL